MFLLKDKLCYKLTLYCSLLGNPFKFYVYLISILMLTPLLLSLHVDQDLVTMIWHEG